MNQISTQVFVEFAGDTCLADKAGRYLQRREPANRRLVNMTSIFMMLVFLDSSSQESTGTSQPKVGKNDK